MDKIKAGQSSTATIESGVALGAPSSGDLGFAMAQNETRAGVATGEPFNANPVGDATRAQAIEQMHTVQQAISAGLFFGGRQALRGEGQSGDTSDRTTEKTGDDLGNLLARLGTGPSASPLARAEQIPSASESSTSNPTANAETHAPACDDSVINPHALTPLVSPYTIQAGTLIPAALVTALNSDLPGLVQATVTQTVYDSVSGHWPLIPQGTKLLGHYEPRILYGQSRALVLWTRLILPDGASLILDDMPGTDATGAAGFADTLDTHTGSLFKAVALSSLLGVGSELASSTSTNGNNSNDIGRALARSIEGTTNQAGQQIVRRNLEIRPTIRIHAGTRVNILVSRDLVLKTWTQP